MACKCDVGLGNTGLPNCQPISSVTRKLILVPTYDSTGAKNYLNLATTLNAAFLTARINDVDDSKRWFPLPAMENVTNEKADSIVEESAGGTKAFVKEGVRSFFAEMWSMSPTFLGKLKQSRCTDVSAFVIDIDGNIIGSTTEDGKLYPIAIDKNSFDPKLVSATDSTIQKVTLGFDWSQDEKDENLNMITKDEYTFNVFTMTGLLDITAKYTSITTSGFTATLSTQYGSKLNPIKDEGLLLADFAVAEVTPTPGAIAITSVTETSAGVYVFVFTTAQSSGDVLRLTPTKNGRDYTAVKASLITIP